MLRVVAAALAAVCGCGRVGFDSLGDGGTVGDGGTPIPLALPPGGSFDKVEVAPDGTWYASSEHAGAFRSTDQMTWERCAPGFVHDLAVASDGTVYAAGGSDGVRSSTDRCATWTRTPVDRYVVAMATRGTEVYALVDNGLRIKNGNAFMMLGTPADGASFEAGASNGSALLIGTYGAHVIVSPTAGTFMNVVAGFNTSTAQAVAIGPSRAYVQTTAQGGSNGSVSCASTANLTSWTVCFGGGGTAIAADPNDDAHVVFAPYDQLAQTQNAFGDYQLDKQQFDMDAGNVLDLAFTPSSGLLAATLRGVFFATDRTLHWQARNTGLAAWEVYDIEEIGGDLYLATQGGVMRSAGGTSPWTLSTTGMILSTSGNNVVGAPDGSLIAGSRGIWRSPDQGTTWTDVFLPSGSDDYRVSTFVFDGMRLFAGSHTRMLYADPPWTTWTPVSIAGQNHFVLALLLTADRHLWVGTGEGLFVSSDNGMTYTQTSPITTDVGGLLALPDGGIIAGTRDGMWITDPSRTTWTKTGPNVTTFRHALIPGGIAGATDEGIYVTRDRGGTWTLLPGTEAFSTRAAYFDRGSGELVYGTIGYGLQRAPLP